MLGWDQISSFIFKTNTLGEGARRGAGGGLDAIPGEECMAVGAGGAFGGTPWAELQAGGLLHHCGVAGRHEPVAGQMQIYILVTKYRKNSFYIVMKK